MRRPSAYRYYLFTEAALSLPTWIVVAIYLVKTVGLDPLQLVLVGTVMEATIFVFEVPTGVVADTFGRKRSLAIAWTIQGAATMLLGAVPHFWAALAGWALWGFGSTFASGAYEAWIVDEVGAENAGPVFARGTQVAYAAGLAGIFLHVALATWSLPAAVIAGGVLTAAVGLVSFALMPETAFTPAPREGRRRAMVASVGTGARLVRGHPVLLLLLGTAFFGGAAAEGFDRLGEAHFLRDVGLPAFAGLSDLWWFSIIGAGSLLAGLVASTVLVRRIVGADDRTMARMLFGVTAVQIAGVAAFALAGAFWLALAAYWLARLVRSVVYPVSMTWLNQSIEDSSVRATVISITGQSGAIGEVAGGPAVGGIGNVLGIRAALVAAALLLSPALGLYGRAIRHGGREPDLDELPAVAAT